ncbi:pentapeptide repeat-containing protein, partial [Streptomyces sp. NPDC001537]
QGACTTSGCTPRADTRAFRATARLHHFMGRHQQASLVSHVGLFESTNGHWMDEPGLPVERPPRLVSTRGVDAAQLTIIDLWMDECRFFGTRNLDQIRIEGESYFAGPDLGMTSIGMLPFRWSRRVAIADEHQWRVGQRQRRSRSWRNDDYDIPGVFVEPAHIAILYRQLRKALEDSKFEPGAGDFYYGEMEMRRRDSRQTSPAERWLLHVYWLVSGYGLGHHGHSAGSLWP